MIGKMFGHYQIAEKLGQGGMGIVCKARDINLCRDVALKVQPENDLSHSETRTRFRRETLALTKNNHPNIEVVYEFDSHEGIDSLVTEYLPGTLLASADYIAAFQVVTATGKSE